MGSLPSFLYLKLLVGQTLLLLYPLCHLANAHHNPVRKVLFSTPCPPTFQVRRPTFRDTERLALDHTDGTWQSWGLTGPVPKPHLETCLPLQEAEQDFQPTASSSRVWAEVETQSSCPLGSGLAFPSIQGDKTSPDFGQPGVDSDSRLCDRRGSCVLWMPPGGCRGGGDLLLPESDGTLREGNFQGSWNWGGGEREQWVILAGQGEAVSPAGCFSYKTWTGD